MHFMFCLFVSIIYIHYSLMISIFYTSECACTRTYKIVSCTSHSHNWVLLFLFFEDWFLDAVLLFCYLPSFYMSYRHIFLFCTWRYIILYIFVCTYTYMYFSLLTRTNCLNLIHKVQKTWRYGIMLHSIYVRQGRAWECEGQTEWGKNTIIKIIKKCCFSMYNGFLPLFRVGFSTGGVVRN